MTQNFNILSVANGGTGVSSPGPAGSVATSDGKAWMAAAPSMFKAYNNSATPQTLAGSTTGVFPAGFFNTTSYITTDLTYTPATNKLMVTVAGTYLVRINTFFTTPPLVGTWYLTVLKNAVAQELSMNFNNASAADATWMVPCAVNDSLQPGFVSTVAAVAAANTAQMGKLSFFQAART